MQAKEARRQVDAANVSENRKQQPKKYKINPELTSFSQKLIKSAPQFLRNVKRNWNSSS